VAVPSTPDPSFRSVRQVETELVSAEMELATLKAKVAGHAGDEPGEHRAVLRRARAQVRVLKEELKRRSGRD
jgi:hypothetical protein